MTTATITDATLLQAMWLASPALPVGGFSYSEALEAAVEAGHVTQDTQARDWLLDQLNLTLARCDLAVVALALGAWRHDDAETIESLNTWFLQTRETRELREQTLQMGRSLHDWLRQRATPEHRLERLRALSPAPSWPVAFALAAAALPTRVALHAFAFGWAENMVAAAVRAVPLGQSAGQRLLEALAEAIPGAVDEALATPGTDRQAFAPMLAILSARHEVQYSRLFRS